MIQKFTETQLKEIKNKFDEISNSMTRMASERDLLKEIYNSLKEEYEIPPKIARKLAKTYHKRNMQEIAAEHADFEETYTTVFEVK
jgi:16S rRNA C967 or C1407 C5-methylase (RsmB/RsmF family)